MHNGVSIVCIKGDRSDKQKNAVIISKKIEKNSTKRNRMRRVIREMIKGLEIECDEFVIIHTKKEKTEKEIKEDLIQVVNKIK